MNCDFVNCINCGTEKMNVKIGEEICPLCGAIGTLSWVDEEEPEMEVSDSEILTVQPHIYHPGHDAYDVYQCSLCGLFDVGYGDYSRKKWLMSSDNLNLENINSEFVDNDDDGFLKFYNIDNKSVDYVELCPRGILENIVNLYGDKAEYKFLIEEYEGQDYFRNIEYVLNLKVSIDEESFVYEIHSSSILEDLKEIENNFLINVKMI